MCRRMVGKNGYDSAIDKEHLVIHETFEKAIQEVTREADVIIKWHIHNMLCEKINKPSILLCNATSWYTEAKHKLTLADKRHEDIASQQLAMLEEGNE